MDYLDEVEEIRHVREAHEEAVQVPQKSPTARKRALLNSPAAKALLILPCCRCRKRALLNRKRALLNSPTVSKRALLKSPTVSKRGLIKSLIV